MAILYETDPFGPWRLRHQYAQREDGQWFGRLIRTMPTKRVTDDIPEAQWTKREDPTDCPPGAFFTAYSHGEKRLYRLCAIQPNLPKEGTV